MKFECLYCGASEEPGISGFFCCSSCGELGIVRRSIRSSVDSGSDSGSEDLGSTIDDLGFPGYVVTSGGEVYRGGKLLSPTVGGGGYSTVFLVNDEGKRVSKSLHRLVCEVFHGAPPEGAVARHKDGDTSNNTADNLEWGSRSDNMKDALEHGSFAVGESHPNSKLSVEDVRDIRARAEKGESAMSISKSIDVSYGTVRSIVAGKTWKGV